MEVLEFLDNKGDVIAKRIPDDGILEVKWGSQLTVRESQEAIFFRDGKALDVFGPGRHILQTQNIPVIGKWVTSFGYGPDSPFRAEVVFVGKQLFLNLKWGTREPILFKDSELQMVRLRSYGSFSIQIKDSLLFVNKIVGTMGLYSTEVISDYLRGIIISKLNVVLARMLKTVFDMPASMEDLNLILRTDHNIVLAESASLGGSDAALVAGGERVAQDLVLEVADVGGGGPHRARRLAHERGVWRCVVVALEKRGEARVDVGERRDRALREEVEAAFAQGPPEALRHF